MLRSVHHSGIGARPARACPPTQLSFRRRCFASQSSPEASCAPSEKASEAPAVVEEGTSSTTSASRRGMLLGAMALALGSAPLGLSAPQAVQAEEGGTSLERAQQILKAIEKDFVENQYYVTGNLTTSLYQPDCTFIDPTTNVKGVVPYTTAVKLLFNPEVSKAELISIKVQDANTIILRWRLEGALKVGLPIKAYTGTTMYNLDEATGLVKRHYETWDISAVDCFVSCFFPSFGAPPALPVEQLRAREAAAA